MQFGLAKYLRWDICLQIIFRWNVGSEKNARLQYLSSRGYLPCFMVFNTTLGSAECYQYTLWQAKCCFQCKSGNSRKDFQNCTYLFTFLHLWKTIYSPHGLKTFFCFFMFMNYTGSCLIKGNAYFSIFFILDLYFKSMDCVVIACKYLFDVFENS